MIYLWAFRMGHSLFHDPTMKSKDKSAEKGLFQSIIMLALFQITFYMPNIFYTLIIKFYQLSFRMGQSTFNTNLNHMGIVGFILRHCIVGMCVVFLCWLLFSVIVSQFSYFEVPSGWDKLPPFKYALLKIFLKNNYTTVCMKLIFFHTVYWKEGS